MQDTAHSPHFHRHRDAMFTAFWSWLDASVQTIRSQPAIDDAPLPNPSDPGTYLPVGVYDPTTVVLVIGFARIIDREASGAYVGLVGQDPTRRWRGLTGFFINWCNACDPSGDQTLKQLHADLVARLIPMKSIHDLPKALRPRDGWFAGPRDDERLIYGGFVNARHGLSSCWEPYDPPSAPGASLVATGPTAAGLGNIVLVEDLAAQHQRLEDVRVRSALWTQRDGTVPVLERLSGLPRSRRIVQRPSRRHGALPATWGAYLDPDSGAWVGPTPNLHVAVAHLVKPSVPLVVRYMPERDAVRLSDLADLVSS